MKSHEITGLLSDNLNLSNDIAIEEMMNNYNHIKEEEEDSDGQETDIKEEDKLSMTSASIQTSKAILGSTILCLPSVFRTVGILFGSLFLLLNGIIGAVVVYLLLKSKDITRKSGFSIFGKITMGSFGTVIVKLLISIGNLGFCCCYFKILGELINTLVSVFLLKDNPGHKFFNNTFYIIICCCILLPIIIKDNVKILSKVSIVGIGGILIFFISIVIIFFIKLHLGQIEHLNMSLLWPNGSYFDFFTGLPCLFLAFSFHFAVFPLYATLKNRDNSTMMKTTSISIAFCYLIYTFTAILGYLMYPKTINDVIIINFKNDLIQYLAEDRIFISVLLCLVIVSFIVALLLTIPIVFNAAKNHFVNLVLFTKKKYKPNSLKEAKITKLGSTIITLILYFTVLTITLLVNNVMILINFVGSTTASSISFILPAVFLLKLLQNNISQKGKYTAVFVLLMGLFGLISFYLTEIIKVFMSYYGIK